VGGVATAGHAWTEEAAAGFGCAPERQGGREIHLAKVVRRARRDEPAALSIEVAGARIAVRLGFDPVLLCAVVRALKEER
jgi:hypothetical protein